MTKIISYVSRMLVVVKAKSSVAYVIDSPLFNISLPIPLVLRKWCTKLVVAFVVVYHKGKNRWSSGNTEWLFWFYFHFHIYFWLIYFVISHLRQYFVNKSESARNSALRVIWFCFRHLQQKTVKFDFFKIWHEFCCARESFDFWSTYIIGTLRNCIPYTLSS